MRKKNVPAEASTDSRTGPATKVRRSGDRTRSRQAGAAKLSGRDLNLGDFSGEAAFPPKLAAKLVSWFERQRRVLPWREEPTPYRVWVSEIMLQQTQVITVVPYFDRFMMKFPTVKTLAEASEEEVISAWAGLGYYSRARNLHRGAREIVAHGFPSDRVGWLGIPGVGEYTAGAVCSIALNQAEALVDGNVERVLSRLFLVSRGTSDVKYKEKVWELARASVSAATRSRFSYSALNQGWMELGALICTPKNPKCGVCPVREFCSAFRESLQAEFPERRAPKKWVDVEERRLAVFSADRTRVTLRQALKGEWRAGLWDFPETLPSKWLGPSRASSLGEVESRHVVTRHRIARVTKVMVLRSAQEGDIATDGLRWVDVELPEVALGSASKKVLQLIRERFFQ